MDTTTPRQDPENEHTMSSLEPPTPDGIQSVGQADDVSSVDSRIMITHPAADGQFPPIDTSSITPLRKPLQRSGTLNAEYQHDEDDEDTTSCRALTKRLVVFALTVWVAQVALAILLKRLGLIQHDFNDIVIEKVVPTLQQQFEAKMTEFGWAPFLENATQWFPESYWARFNETLSMGHLMKERERPGFQLAKEGAKAQYPVVMIPGFVTSGLEIWQGKECARKYFRTRLWGGISSIRQLVLERECFFEHLSLDPVTGKDPEGIRLRAAQGFEAADYFVPSYWVWGKIIENLADVGYDGSLMSMAPYDWRLAFPLLEERDGYFTKLKFHIESFKKTTGKKVILTSHSLGGILVHYFFAWVTASEKEGGGGGGKKWVDENIHAYINIAGAHLGVPKAASALLSGEMSDTVVRGPLANIVEQFVGRKLRRDLWSTWGSLWSMLPKGGDAIYGPGVDFLNKHSSNTTAIDMNSTGDFYAEGGVSPLFIRTDYESEESGALMERDGLGKDTDRNQENASTRARRDALEEFSSYKRPTIQQTIDFLLKWGDGRSRDLSSPQLHHFDGTERSSSRTWHDLTQTPLPYAPNMKVYCLYGVGLDTERGYYYKKNSAINQASSADENGTVTTESHLDPPFILDSSIDDPENNIRSGVKYSDGDQSVPVLSLGYMCADAWRRKDSGLNPSGTPVITREYMHRSEFDSSDPMRSGPYSGDHVDILGNVDLISDLTKIITEHRNDEVEDRIVSDILEMAKQINEHRYGGVFHRRRKNHSSRRQRIFHF